MEAMENFAIGAECYRPKRNLDKPVEPFSLSEVDLFMDIAVNLENDYWQERSRPEFRLFNRRAKSRDARNNPPIPMDENLKKAEQAKDDELKWRKKSNVPAIKTEICDPQRMRWDGVQTCKKKIPRQEEFERDRMFESTSGRYGDTFKNFLFKENVRPPLKLSPDVLRRVNSILEEPLKAQDLAKIKKKSSDLDLNKLVIEDNTKVEKKCQYENYVIFPSRLQRTNEVFKQSTINHEDSRSASEFVNAQNLTTTPKKWAMFERHHSEATPQGSSFKNMYEQLHSSGMNSKNDATPKYKSEN